MRRPEEIISQYNNNCREIQVAEHTERTKDRAKREKKREKQRYGTEINSSIVGDGSVIMALKSLQIDFKGRPSAKQTDTKSSYACISSDSFFSTNAQCKKCSADKAVAYFMQYTFILPEISETNEL